MLDVRSTCCVSGLKLRPEKKHALNSLDPVKCPCLYALTDILAICSTVIPPGATIKIPPMFDAHGVWVIRLIERCGSVTTVLGVLVDEVEPRPVVHLSVNVRSLWFKTDTRTPKTQISPDLLPPSHDFPSRPFSMGTIVPEQSFLFPFRVKMAQGCFCDEDHSKYRGRRMAVKRPWKRTQLQAHFRRVRIPRSEHTTSPLWTSKS